MSNYRYGMTMRARASSLGPRGRNVYAPMGLGATDLAIDAGGGIGAQANRIDREWRPTGYYTPQDVIGIVGQLVKVYVKVREPLARFVKDHQPPSLWAVRSRAELAKIDETNMRAQQYSNLSVTAISQGMKYMDAPGLKSMVVGYLKRMSIAVSALHQMVDEWNAAARAIADAAGSAINPLAGAMFSVMRGFASAMAPVLTSVGNAIMKVGGVAYDVVKAAASFVAKIPDTIGSIFNLLKWGVILYGGGLLYKEVPPPPGSSR